MLCSPSLQRWQEEERLQFSLFLLLPLLVFTETGKAVFGDSDYKTSVACWVHPKHIVRGCLKQCKFWEKEKDCGRDSSKQSLWTE